MDFLSEDAVSRRVAVLKQRAQMMRDHDFYFYNQPVQEVLGGSKVIVNGREMGMYASYSYLGLVGHPRINEAAKRAIDKFGTGTHGVRTLAGSLTIHRELEETIASFKHAEDAITYTSGYATNLTVISTLMGRGDYVLSDKLSSDASSIMTWPTWSIACSRSPKVSPSWWWPMRSSAWTAM